MARDGLGELEHQTMLALLRLRDDAYTAPIAEELERCTARRTTVAAVYIVLRRLEEKGLVRSRLAGSEDGAGRDRRYFEVTESGLERLRRAREAYATLWEGLDSVLARSR